MRKSLQNPQFQRIIKKNYGGKFPKDKNSLLNLPGIGDYTAAAMQSIGFNLKANVIDGNVERIISRLFAINTPIISSKKLIKSFAENIQGSLDFDIEIIFHDELLTSEIARNSFTEMRKSGVTKKKSSDYDDISASIILQSWINENIID